MRTSISLFIFIVALLVSGCSSQADRALPQLAKNGVLDLRDHDFDRSPAVSLRGEWQLFRQQLLDPSDLQQALAPQPDGVVSMPGDWKARPAGSASDTAPEFATLRLMIYPRASLQPLALQFAASGSAYRVWVDGELLAENGRLSREPSDEVNNPALVRVPVRVSGRPIELLLQVSNHEYKTGLFHSIEMGQTRYFEETQHQKWGLALAVVGTLILMGLYHLALYLLRRTERGALYLGLYCLLWAVYVLCAPNSGWAIHSFSPRIPGEFINRAYPFCYFVAIPLGYQFLRAVYPQEFPSWLQWLFWGVGGTFAVVAIFGPKSAPFALFGVFHLFSALKLIVSVTGLGFAAWRRREGAVVILFGYVGLGAMGANDMLYDLGVFNFVLLLHVGMLFLTFSQALALALRFSRLFSAVEDLSSELVHKNSSLEAEIAERERLQEEVVSVSEDERRRISHELHDGLCQQLTGARLRASGLANLLPADDERSKHLAELSALLEESVDHAYELSHGLWPMVLESDDIAAALSLLVQRQAEASGVRIVFRHQGDSQRVTPNNAAQLYAIAREAIANALKHAEAKCISVELDCQPGAQASLCVSDDGIGRRPGKKTKGGLGLKIMSYRARMVGGEFRIEDGEGGGTRVRCSVPCDAPQAEQPLPA